MKELFMRKTIALLTATLFAGVLIAELEFDQKEIVYSATFLDEKTEAIFRFTNTGNETVTLLNPTSSCGCTVPKLAKKEYLPGESGEIKAIFTYGSRVGVQRKRITVRTSNPGEETYLLTMVTHIPEWVKVEPRVLRWKMAEAGGPQQIKVTVANPDKVSLQLPEEAFRFFTVEINENGPGEYVFTVTPKSISAKATEFLKFNAIVTSRGATKNRQFGVHCLIR
jgi:hypothetical protein